MKTVLLFICNLLIYAFGPAFFAGGLLKTLDYQLKEDSVFLFIGIVVFGVGLSIKQTFLTNKNDA
mgnify:CR=1 FL=1